MLCHGLNLSLIWFQRLRARKVVGAVTGQKAAFRRAPLEVFTIYLSLAETSFGVRQVFSPPCTIPVFKMKRMDEEGVVLK